ncbi:MAG TPA: glycosyl transferase, partial [Paracoccus sp.]|nr:glycosyl transferase [Paracoccus sp. (in: a-proteobacteria)]
RGHIGRVGLAGQHSAPGQVNRLIPAVRADLEHEGERIRDLEIEGFQVISPALGTDANAAALARLLDLDPDTALALAGTDHLFDD